MSFAQADFPRQTSIFDGSERRRARASIVTADRDNVRTSFGHARGDDSNASSGDELDADARAGIDGPQVVDELGEVLDAVNVVMRRRRNERRAGSRMANSCDIFGDFAGGELTAFTWLGALGHLDFEFFRVDEVVRGDAEAAGGDLLDLVGGSRIEAIGVGILAAFASVAAAADQVHAQGESAMSFGAERTERHRLRAKAANNRVYGFHFFDGNGSAGNGFEQIAKKDSALEFG